MKKDITKTPRSRIRSALRMLWLRSRERAYALKLAGNKCFECGKKASKKHCHEVKVEVHHKNMISNWEKVIDNIYDQLLISPEKLEVLCKNCHLKKHRKETENAV